VSDKRVFNIDSQILSAHQRCPRNAKITFWDHLRPKEKSYSLERGSLVHTIMEIYYSIVGRLEKSKLFQEMESQGLIYEADPEDRMQVAAFAIEVGRYIAAKGNIDATSAQEVFFQCSEYFKYYKNDSYLPVAVESVAVKKIYEDQDFIFTYTGKIDLVFQRGNRVYPMDTKTQSRRTDPSSMTNQFLGYCFLLNTLEILINVIGFQTSLKPHERFNRNVITYTPARLKEWVENTVTTMFEIVECVDTEQWPMRYVSCDGKFGPCDNKIICQADPSTRLYMIDAHYQVTEAWDVGALGEVNGEEQTSRP